MRSIQVHGMIEVKGDGMAMGIPMVKKSDVQIQQDVMRELRWDTRIGSQTEVGVEVDKGIVTLTGTVDGFAKKSAARQAAHRVSGVLDVVDNLKIHVPGGPLKSDAEIAMAVRRTLEWDVFVPDQKIRSTVSEGWVTLEGEVDFLQQKQDAVRAVQNLAGVKGVANLIRVKVAAVQPQLIHKRIEEALERRAEREAERIAVRVDNGAVTLEGRVRSWFEKDAILNAVGHAPGVGMVNDKLRVDPLF
jgi:osmotically-inducible protein OsmY